MKQEQDSLYRNENKIIALYINPLYNHYIEMKTRFPFLYKPILHYIEMKTTFPLHINL